MSLTSEARLQMAQVKLARSESKVAELATLLRFCGGLHLISGRIAIEVELSESELARRISKVLGEVFSTRSEISVINATSKRDKGYLLRVTGHGELLARQTGLIDVKGKPVRGLPASLVSSTIEEAISAWRGAFMASGVLSDPAKMVSLEVVAPTNEAAMALVGLARRLEVPAKTREVRATHRVMVREPEAIATMMKLLGAEQAWLQWDEIRQRRGNQMPNQRLANFDDANLRRSAQAAVAAGARVQRALEILADEVPEHLKYAGELRLEHQNASLDELGRLASPPMTKDAIAGRIRRLLAMADKKAEELGIPDTEEALQGMQNQD
ncbi:MAG: DNA-binding protein WhiA [Microbacteriaceae bacterium]|nr:DNA-binding protein WhiA [Microbacteriaceae bacterium]MDR9443444.1 DNA-binding protein WhiA [Microbacteriaceae bacterium]